MPPPRITGPAYTDTEKAFVQAGLKQGKNAREIAVKLPGRDAASVYNHAVNVYNKRLPLSGPEDGIKLPDNGRVAFRVPVKDLAAVQAGLSALEQKHNFTTLTQCAIQALIDAGP